MARVGLGLILLFLGGFFVSVGVLGVVAGVGVFVLRSDFSAMAAAMGPITIGMIVLRASRRLRNPAARSDSDDSTDENTTLAQMSPGEASEEQIDRAFDEALALEQRGEWAQAISLYETLAAHLEGQPNAEYARNCADRLRDRMNPA